MNAHITISNILNDDEAIELIENSEKESEENRENELREEFEFISNQLYLLSNRLEIKGNTYLPFFSVSNYNSPIQSVITPPPNNIT